MPGVFSTRGCLVTNNSRRRRCNYSRTDRWLLAHEHYPSSIYGNSYITLGHVYSIGIGYRRNYQNLHRRRVPHSRHLVERELNG